jgi:hypothetical protein
VILRRSTNQSKFQGMSVTQGFGKLGGIRLRMSNVDALSSA